MPRGIYNSKHLSAYSAPVQLDDHDLRALLMELFDEIKVLHKERDDITKIKKELELNKKAMAQALHEIAELREHILQLKTPGNYYGARLI